MSRQITVTAADVTLFDVAARELGDPLAWWQIAEASGLSDPWLPQALTVLTIPSQAADDGDGLPT